MRKYVQKWILDIIGTISEGIEYVLNPKIETSSRRLVLQDCYEALNAVQQAFELGLSKERYSYYKEIIVNLENALKELDRDIDIIERKALTVLSKEIKKSIKLLKEQVVNEVEVKLEIVFMPYKASMWDSLESIWRAAKDDDRCECYVMPIPYYARNSNANLSEFHYEGNEFPKDVPIMHYESYDVSVRQPDIIYIHNPYDEYNYVTSVHPNYYSYELKKYTDMLVYVPYFITGGNVPEGQKSLSVFNYMDKMILQNNEQKQFYKSILPENKLLALGSPKVDRMIYFEEHKQEISSEWKDIIQDKKVVMYNVSISGILKDRITAIKKMEYVFSVFKDRNDVVLLWRPHPLIESTLKSMVPHLLEEYLRLKEWYISEKVGIYDETADVTASIAISDAYIGEDSSSMVHLFGVTGKPIFLLNPIIDSKPTEEDIRSVSFIDGYIENDNMWFVSSGINVLCRMDLNTEKIEVIKQITSSTHPEIIQYSDVIKIENEIYMLPYLSSDMCEYDLEKNILKKKNIPNSAIVNFDRMIRYKEYILMKPTRYSAIIQYNIKTDEYKYHKKCLKEFEKVNEDKPVFMWAVCVRDNLLLMASSITNKVLEFNMDNGISKVHIVGAEKNNYFGMAFDGKDYWLIPEDGNTIVRWNYETGKTTEYNDYPQNFVGETRGFIGIVCCGEYMLAFPREANMIIKIDIATGNISEFKASLSYHEGDRKSCYNAYSSNYYFVKKYDDKHVIALTAFDNNLLIINTETGECCIKECKISIEDVKKYINKDELFGKLDENMPYASRENKYFSLEEFIDDYVFIENKNNSLAQKKNYSHIINNMDGTCGEKVHNYIKEQLFKNGR